MNFLSIPIVRGDRWERIWMLARIEFKLRYYENKLGLLWALIKPVSQIAMYYIVFQVLLNQRVPNYAIYLWAGLFLWLFFTECTTGMIKVLQAKKYLYTHTNMDKIEIYLSYMLSATISLLINFGIFIIGSMIAGIMPTYHYIYFVLIFLNLFLLSLGATLILSNLFLLFKDISQVWGIITSFGFFLSPILYRGEIFEEKMPWLNYLNPISGIIINARNVLLYARPPDWQMLFFDLAYASVVVLVGFLFLQRLGPRASELL